MFGDCDATLSEEFLVQSGPPSHAIALIREGIALLASEDRSGWGSSARSAEVAELSEVCERLEAERVRAVGAWDAGHDWAADGALGAAPWLRSWAGMSRYASKQLVRSARVAREHEAVGTALRAGAMSTGQLDVLARATRGRTALLERDVELLVDIASRFSVDDFATAMAHWRSAADDEMAADDANLAFHERTLSWLTTLDGRFELRASLDADGGATVIKALEALDCPDAELIDGGPADGPRTLGQRLADGLVQLCAESLGDRERSGHATPGVDGLIDVERLTARPRGRADGSLGDLAAWLRDRCELAGVGPIARDAMVRLACDAAVGRIVMRGRSEVLDVGRRTRVVPRALRRAIELRDVHCTFPGCDAPLRWCDVHHLVHWADGGTTDLDNCTLLCRRHHVLTHEGGWRLARRPDGIITIATRGRPVPRGRRRRPPRSRGGYALAA
ncbi:MAG: DUF222 domain-containing protein [Acidimicrobiia bacterium]